MKGKKYTALILTMGMNTLTLLMQVADCSPSEIEIIGQQIMKAAADVDTYSRNYIHICAESAAAKACEDKGHLYSVAPAFQLHSMWGYGDVIKGQSGVTFEELFRLLKDSGKDLNAITGFSADEPVLTNLCAVSMDEFVDWEEGTCSFDGDYFKRMLSFTGEYTGNDAGGTYSERIGKREVVLSVGNISSVADYQIEKEIYGGDNGNTPSLIS